MENWINEQMRLFADRTSCQLLWLNPFRLLIASSAYILVNGLREVARKGTTLARAQVATSRN